MERVKRREERREHGFHSLLSPVLSLSLLTKARLGTSCRHRQLTLPPTQEREEKKERKRHWSVCLSGKEDRGMRRKERERDICERRSEQEKKTFAASHTGSAMKPLFAVVVSSCRLAYYQGRCRAQRTQTHADNRSILSQGFLGERCGSSGGGGGSSRSNRRT